VRLLIAEDDPSLAEALRFSLARAGHAVDWIPDGALADHVLRESVFDLVILDLGLPRLDGHEILRRLRKRNAQIAVLILSARDAADEKVKALDLGADDYIAKPFSLSELQARVRALLRRQQGKVEPVIYCGRLSFDTATRSASVAGRALPLSAHETCLLEILLRRAGRALSKEHILEQLYNYDKCVSHNALEVSVHRLRRKLEGSGVAVRTVHGRGYLLEEQKAGVEKSN
jgi:DNA-binding response OmpR family regulator